MKDVSRTFHLTDTAFPGDIMAENPSEAKPFGFTVFNNGYSTVFTQRGLYLLEIFSSILNVMSYISDEDQVYAPF